MTKEKVPSPQTREIQKLLEERPKRIDIDESHFYYQAVPVERWFEDFVPKLEAYFRGRKIELEALKSKMWDAHQKTIDNLVELGFKHKKLLRDREKLGKLIDELKEALENPNIYCNNCKDLSAENTIQWVLERLVALEKGDLPK